MRNLFKLLVIFSLIFLFSCSSESSGDSEPDEDVIEEESGRQEASKVSCTGQKSCYSDDDYVEVGSGVTPEAFRIECPDKDGELFGQDAWYAEAGFCRSHIYSASGDSESGIVVKDESTGLEWQQEISGKYTYEEALNYCENLEYGGFGDWRVPSMQELVSLIELRCFNWECQNIDETYFPNTPKSFFWSSQKKITADVEPYNAWGVYFWSGYTESAYMGNAMSVRCVRGEPLYSVPEFELSVRNGDEIVTDKNTNLIWQKTHTMLNWKEALSYCENLDYAGYGDWRLPNRNELLSLVDYEKTDPASSFPDMVSEIFWSSTTDVMFEQADCADSDEDCGPNYYDNVVLYADFKYGNSGGYPIYSKEYGRYVKCVR